MESHIHCTIFRKLNLMQLKKSQAFHWLTRSQKSQQTNLSISISPNNTCEMDQLCLCQYCKCIYLSCESIMGFTCKDCYIVVAASLRQVKGLRCNEKNCNNPSANYGDTNYCRDHSCWHGHHSFKEEGGYCVKCFCGSCGRIKRKFFPNTKRCECKKGMIISTFV